MTTSEQLRSFWKSPIGFLIQYGAGGRRLYPQLFGEPVAGRYPLGQVRLALAELESKEKTMTSELEQYQLEQLRHGRLIDDITAAIEIGEDDE